MRHNGGSNTGLVYLKNSFSYSAATLWNSLPCNIRESASLNLNAFSIILFKHTAFMEIRFINGILLYVNIVLGLEFWNFVLGFQAFLL